MSFNMIHKQPFFCPAPNIFCSVSYLLGCSAQEDGVGRPSCIYNSALCKMEWFQSEEDFYKRNNGCGVNVCEKK